MWLSCKGFWWRALVDDQPIVTKVFDDDLEFAEIYRFLNIAVYAEPVAIDEVALFAGGGHDDDGNRLSARIFFEFAENFKAVELGKF